MIIPNKKLKIALIGFRLSIGGSEKVMANLSIFFQENNIDVHIIIIEDGVTYPFGGELVNLGLLKNSRNDIFNKLKRLKALRKYLNQNKFDFIIDFRYRPKILQELILIKLIYNTKVIFTVHSFMIEQYLPKNTFLTQFLYANAHSVISISKKMESAILSKHQLKNVQTIFNPVNLTEINNKKDESILLNFQFIIAVGQFVNHVKQFDKLIESYAKSHLPNNEIHLVILGDGILKKDLQNIATINNVGDKVHFLGQVLNPYAYISKAKFLVLSSKYEGMPNVILEALACGIPVISFDCDSGPSEMIIHNKNGLLVENQNWEKLTESMDLFLEDKDLYNNCLNNAYESVLPFGLENIGKQWLNLLTPYNI